MEGDQGVGVEVYFRYRGEHSSHRPIYFVMPRATFSPRRLIHKLLDNGAELVRHGAVYRKVGDFDARLELLKPDFTLGPAASLDLELGEATEEIPWIAAVVRGCDPVDD